MIGTTAKDHPNESDFIEVVKKEGKWIKDFNYKKDGTPLVERAQISPIVDRNRKNYSFRKNE